MDNKTDQMIIALMFNVVMALNIVSYLIASFKRPKTIPQVRETLKSFKIDDAR